MYKDEELIYAATSRCKCGAGLAYPQELRHGNGPFKIPSEWECSDILTGRAIPKGQEGAKTHSAPHPFAFFEIKSEKQPSANGLTTRPSGIVPTPEPLKRKAFVIPVWKEGMTAEQGKNVAYMERNLLALWTAKLLNDWAKEQAIDPVAGWYYDTDNNWAGWLRVVSLDNGRVTFHVPDDFPLGDLPEIQPNWVGNSTEEKWRDVMRECGIQVEGIK